MNTRDSVRSARAGQAIALGRAVDACSGAAMIRMAIRRGPLFTSNHTDMKRRQFLTLSASLPAVLALPGCSHWWDRYRDLKEPRVMLAGLALTDANPLSPRFRVRLQVENPNDVGIEMQGADATLSLNGTAVATGQSRSPLALASGGVSDIDVDVATNTLAIIQTVADALSRPSIRYAVAGHLTLVNWMGPLGQLPFQFDGTLDRAVLLKGL